MRKASLVSAFLCGLSLLFLAATPASADPNAPGNNGTIKIHESPGEREPAMANDPHVCLFHIHGFKFDNNSTGEAWIESWPPTGNRSQAGTAAGRRETRANGARQTSSSRTGTTRRTRSR